MTFRFNPSGFALALAVMLAAALPTLGVTPATASTAAPAQAPVTAQDLQQLVNTINDPQERQKLVGELQSLIAAKSHQAAPPAPATPQAILDTLTAEINAITAEIVAAAQVAVDAPRLIGWIGAQADDKTLREFWLAIFARLAIVFGAGLAADRVCYFLLSGIARRIALRPGGSTSARLLLMLIDFIIDAVPVFAFAAAAAFAVPFTHADFGTRRVARTLIGAIFWSRLILAGGRSLLLSAPASGLYPLAGETRQYLYIWTRRFAGWLIYGFALAAASWWLGVPGAIYALILRVTILVLAILAIVFILQNRRAVALWLRGPGGGGAWRVVRQRLAETWHVLAVIYIAGTFGVYVLNVGGGYLLLLRATLVTVVVMLAAALFVRSIERLSRRGFAVSPELKARYPTLETRVNRYIPVLFYVGAAIIYGLAALAILQGWGVDAFAWLGGATGQSAAGTIVAVVAVVLAALAAWELFSAMIERVITQSGNHASPERMARLRTLMPMVRTSVLVIIVVLTGLVVLSEVGVNTAPLLAGAGVIGLAIGLASQALIKDLIVGLIILAEDTFSVGDVVDVGNGHSGVVEAISVRAMRLRDTAGTVHTVPFSDVSAVKNLTKGFSYYVINLGVSYNADTDHVVATLREVGEEMQRDPKFAPLMLEPVEIMGVDQFQESAVVIALRLKTPPMQQWTVGREFNRRMKKAFDERGIELPFPQRTITFGKSESAEARRFGATRALDCNDADD